MLHSIPYLLALIILSVSSAKAQEAASPCTEEIIVEQFSCPEDAFHCHQLIEEYPLPENDVDSLLANVLYANPRKPPEQVTEEIDSLLTIPPAGLTLVEFTIDTAGSTGKHEVVCARDQNQAEAAREFVKEIQFTPAKTRGRAVVYYQSWLLQPFKENEPK